LPPTLRAAGLTPELGKFKRLLKTYLFHVVETAAHSDYLQCAEYKLTFSLSLTQQEQEDV